MSLMGADGRVCALVNFHFFKITTITEIYILCKDDIMLSFRSDFMQGGSSIENRPPTPTPETSPWASPHIPLCRGVDLPSIDWTT